MGHRLRRGRGSDVVARGCCRSHGPQSGRPIVINNKPGAGTNIAAEYSARSHDYGNLMFTADFATLAANPFLFRKLNYNAERTSKPVGMLVRFPMLLVVNNDVPVSNLSEFVAWAKQQKTGVSWGSAGLGSPHHLVGELFREEAGLGNMTHVRHRGAAPAVQDVIGGQIPAMWADSATIIPFLGEKKLKAIGVASPALPTSMCCPRSPPCRSRASRASKAMPGGASSCPRAARPRWSGSSASRCSLRWPTRAPRPVWQPWG